MSDSTKKPEEELGDELGLDEWELTEVATPTSPQQSGPSLPDAASPSMTREILDGNLDEPVELTDFMFKLGLHYNLPGRAETTLEAPAFVRKRRTRIWLVLLAVVVTALGGAVPFLARPKPVTTLPTVVLGEWQADSKRYEGRKLILSAERVRIDFGDRSAAVEFPITDVRTRVTPEAVEYRISYRQDRGLTQFVFTFAESTWPPSIHLSNPEGVRWVRSKDVEAIRREQARASRERQRR